MNGRIFVLTHDSRRVLGFDTGLNAQAFARAKMAQFISSPGYIVYPNGKIDTWRAEGILEAETMIVRGAFFPGEALADILQSPDGKDRALDALRFWLNARILLEKELPDGRDDIFPGPAGAFIAGAGAAESPGEAYPEGTVFFPPARLVKRTLDADNAASSEERWVHPDLEGSAAVSFSAGAMLYRIFCGSAPFPGESGADSLRRDIREAVFVPPRLAAPGLDSEMAGLITRTINKPPARKGGKPADREADARPAPESISVFLGAPCSKPASAWIKTPGGEESEKIRAEREQYLKKSGQAVKVRRFARRNAARIAGILAASIVLVFFIRGIAKHRAALPSTRGMSPVEVAAAYYGAFDALDNVFMGACVSGRAGRGDIELAANIFVTNRVRQAYEVQNELLVSARDWIKAGRPATNKTIFGITDINFNVLSEGDGNAAIEADYILWMPVPFLNNEGEAPAGKTNDEGNIPPQPAGFRNKDRLTLVFQKGVWRITEITRVSSPVNAR